jgi:hypothetical protein
VRPGPAGTRREALHQLVQDAGRAQIRVTAYVPGRLVVLTRDFQPNPCVSVCVMADYPRSLSENADPAAIAATRVDFERIRLQDGMGKRYAAYACDPQAIDEWLAEQAQGAAGALIQFERIRL